MEVNIYFDQDEKYYDMKSLLIVSSSAFKVFSSAFSRIQFQRWKNLFR